MSHLYNTGYAVLEEVTDPNNLPELQSGHKIRIAVTENETVLWTFKIANPEGQKWVKSIPDHLAYTDRDNDFLVKQTFLNGIEVQGIAQATQLKATDGTDSTELKYFGVSFNRATSYLRPTQSGNRTLYIGGSTLGSNDWATVKVYTNGVDDFQWNDEIVATQDWVTGTALNNVAYTNVDNNFSVNQTFQGTITATTFKADNDESYYAKDNAENYKKLIRYGRDNNTYIGDSIGELYFANTVGRQKVYHEGNLTNVAYTNVDNNFSTDQTFQGVITHSTSGSGGNGLVLKTDNAWNSGNNSPFLKLENSNNSYRVRVNNSGNLSFYNSSLQSKVGIAQNGNVGIGTNNPGFALDIHGDNNEGVLSVKNAANARDTFRSENASGTRTVNIGNDVSGHGNILIRNSSGATTNYISGSGNSYFNGGNVGIGTSSPSEKLEVDGNITATNIYAKTYRSSRSDGDIYIQADTASDFVSIGTQVANNLMRIQGNGNVGIGTDSPLDLLAVHNSASGAVDAQMNFTTADTGQSISDGFRVGWNGDVAQMYLFEDADMRFGTNNVEKMRITSTGNVGIGTTNPQAKLDVNGNILAIGTITGSNLSGTNTGDQDLSGYLLNTTDTLTGALTIDGDIRGAGQQLVLNAGESSSYATGQSGEYIYLNSEQGIQVNTSTGNWSTGWDGRKTAYLRGDLLTLDGESINKTNFQNFKTAYGWGDHSLAGYTGDQDLSGYLLKNNTLTDLESNPVIPFKSFKLYQNNVTSYRERVILIIPQVLTNDASYNTCVGSIIAAKQGGNVFDTFDISVQSVWNRTVANFISKGERIDHKFVTCTYNGVVWVAIKLQYSSNPYNHFHFTGKHVANSLDVNGDALKVISYYDVENSVATNSEINNSITTLVISYDSIGINGKTVLNKGNFISGTDYVAPSSLSGYVTLSGTNQALTGSYRSINNSNSAGANFSVSTTDKSAYEYAYEVIRNGATVGGFRIDGGVSGSNLSGTNTGDQDLSGYLLNTTDTLNGNLTISNNTPVLDIRALDETTATIRLCDNEADTGQMGRIEYNTATSDSLRFYVNSTTSSLTLNQSSAVFTGNVTATNFTGSWYGKTPSSSSTVSTVVERDASGDINARLFRSEYDVTNSSVNFIMTQIDTDSNNYIRPTTPSQFRAFVTDSYYQPSGNYFTDGDSVLYMTNDDGFVYDDTNNKMFVKKDSVNYEIFDRSNLVDNKNYTNGIGVSGSYLGAHYSAGGTEKPNSSTFGAGKLKLAMLSSSNLGFASAWNDVLWLSSYSGGDVKGSSALVFSKYNNDIFIASQDYDSGSWGTGYKLFTTANFIAGSHYVVPSSLNNYLLNTTDTLTGTLTVTDDINIGTYGTSDTGVLYLNGNMANRRASLKCTNGNLHIDSNDGTGIYLNYYSGSIVHFGNGAGGTVASISSTGNIKTNGTLEVVNNTNLLNNLFLSGDFSMANKIKFNVNKDSLNITDINGDKVFIGTPKDGSFSLGDIDGIGGGVVLLSDNQTFNIMVNEISELFLNNNGVKITKDLELDGKLKLSEYTSIHKTDSANITYQATEHLFLNDNGDYATVRAGNYKSSDGSSGITDTFSSIDGTIYTVKNGLIVNKTLPV